MEKAVINHAKVLLVDDAAINMAILTKILAGKCGLRTAASGNEALETIRQGFLPDVILMDVAMPEMDGYEACQALKANNQTADVPIIFLSAADTPEAKLKGFACGGVDYITKPFITQEVLIRIELQIINLRLKKSFEALLAPSNTLSHQSREKALFIKAVRMMKTHLSNPPTLLEISFNIGCNPHKLTEIFRHQTGKTVFEFFQNLRLEKARLLLEQGDLQIQVIASKVGYKNAGDFTRAFIRQYGISPKLYKIAKRL